jgi:hypothetical protein
MTNVRTDVDSPTISSPLEVLTSLAVTARELYDAFVLDRAPAVRRRLQGRVKLIAAPFERTGTLQPGDILVRGAVGENQMLIAILVDGVTLDIGAATMRGWQTESAVPGCFAWVIEDEPVSHPREEQWARRITDADGYLVAGQAVIRFFAAPGAIAEPTRPQGLFDPTESVGGLRSALLSGDDTLDSVAAGTLRLAAQGTAGEPAPVLSAGPAVAKVQTALITLGYALPRFGADGTFGAETAAAVSTFKSAKDIQPPDPVVGRATIAALDTALLASNQPSPPPGPAPQPAPWPIPTPVRGHMQPGDHLWHYRGLISPANNIPAEWFPHPTKAERYEGHGADITHYVLHTGDRVYCGQPHLAGQPGTWAWLNNNPGNITRGGMNLGQYPGKVNWHNFLIFPSYDIGFRAIGEFMRNGRYSKSGFYRELSLTEAFRHYAPAGDGANDPARYGREVAEALGVSEDTPVGDLTNTQMLRMQDKIQQIEGFRPGRILARDDADLPAAVRTALS